MKIERIVELSMMKVLWPKDCEDIRKALIEYAEVLKARDRKVGLNCHGSVGRRASQHHGGRPVTSDNETVEEIVNEMRDKWAQFYYSEGTRRKDGKYSEFPAIDTEEVASRIEAVHRREIAELRECLRLSSNEMEMVVQWLGRYPKWQECLTQDVARNRKALEGGES